MKHVTYVMQFKGTATTGAGPGTLRANTSATSCTIKTTIGVDGIESSFHPAEGGMAFFESEVAMSTPDSFTETGSITFGEGDNTVRFSTVGQGHLTAGSDGKTMIGSVIWKIDSGEGQFEGASGFITSNFFMLEDGQVTDYHLGVVYLK